MAIPMGGSWDSWRRVSHFGVKFHLKLPMNLPPLNRNIISHRTDPWDWYIYLHLYVNIFHQKFEWDLTNGPLGRLLELLNTQVYWSVQWVLLEISWIYGKCMYIFQSYGTSSTPKPFEELSHWCHVFVGLEFFFAW